ncbi:peptidoglycan-binding domain-containing protein [Coleofasciculus sp. FACHB-125]|uniref:peptidoglycan-binding domain-containing protein n=1 Tax=Coleofasciculus sp. FACHB-125 TaxID=2692784 RepID=UPI001683F61B|nr:peptidoglycan-binding protein [Coleofasciculus sp. FACHB-125]
MATAILRNGSQGDEVRILQASLHSARFLSETPDGIFGDRTEKAVRAFQQKYGLSVDGEVGDETWAKLQEVTA